MNRTTPHVENQTEVSAGDRFTIPAAGTVGHASIDSVIEALKQAGTDESLALAARLEAGGWNALSDAELQEVWQSVQSVNAAREAQDPVMLAQSGQSQATGANEASGQTADTENNARSSERGNENDSEDGANAAARNNAAQPARARTTATTVPPAREQLPLQTSFVQNESFLDQARSSMRRDLSGFDSDPLSPSGTRASTSETGFRKISANLGVGGELTSSASDLVLPFVQQNVTANGSLSSPVEFTGPQLSDGGPRNAASQVGRGNVQVSLTQAGPFTGPPVSLRNEVVPTVNPNGDAKVALNGAAHIAEGSDGETIIRFTVTRSNGAMAESIPWTVDGIQADDLARGALSGNVMFAAGALTQTVEIVLHRDSTVESDETVTLRLADGLYSKIAQGSAAVVIENDDFATVSVEAGGTIVAEGNPADGGLYTTVSFIVTRTAPAGQAAGVPLPADRVDWSVAAGGPGQITRGDLHEDDYAGVINFAEGQTSVTVTLRVLRDAISEDNKNIDLSISTAHAVYARPGASSASITLADDDTQVNVEVMASSILEGTDDGDRIVSFTVTRGNGLLADSFGWDVSGIQESDLASGSLTGIVAFAAGETSKQIVLRLKQDSTVEADESLVLTLHDGAHGVAGAAAEIMIGNDDFATVSVAAGTDGTVIEGDLADGGPYTTVSFVVTRALPAGHEAGVPLLADRIDWSVATGGLGQITQTDLHADDYAGTINFADGQMSATVTLRVLRDTIDEGNKSIDLRISAANAVYSVLGTSNAGIMLADDDATIRVTSEAPSVLEGTEDGARVLTFTATRTNGLLADSFDWNVAGIQESDLASGVLNGKLAFAAGETSKQIVLRLKQDSTVEINETVVLSLENGNHATVAGEAARITLINDDFATVSVMADVTEPVVEGDSTDEKGPYTLVNFTITRTLPDGHDDGVPLLADEIGWSVATGGLNQVMPGDLHQDDYVGTVTFAEGEMTTVLTLRVLRNSIEEGNKTIDLRLNTDPSLYAKLGIEGATVMLADDDGKISAIASTAARITEGSSEGEQDLTFTVTRTNGLLKDSFNWHIAGIQEGDLASGVLTGKLEFASGETSKLIVLKLKQDRTVEKTEDIVLTIENGNHATSTGTTTVTLVNDDFATVSVAADTLLPVVEGDVADGGDYTTVSFTVTRSLPEGHLAGVPLLADRIDWSVATGGAGQITQDDLHADDYAGTIDFAEGQMTATVTLRVLRNTVEEGNKTIDLSLSADNALYGKLGTASASVMLADDDGKVSVTGEAASIVEGTAAGERLVNFTVTRTNGLLADSFNWSVAGIQESDLASGSLTGTIGFSSGETSKIIQLHLKQDSTVEINEDIVFTVQNGDHATSTGPATITLVNDDLATVSVAADILQPVPEGDVADGGPYTNVSFTVTRTLPVGHAAGVPLLADRIDWSVATGGLGQITSADLHSDDYAGTINFAEGQMTATVTLRVLRDTVEEGNKSIDLSISAANAVYSALGTNNASIMLADDDGKVTVTTDAASVSEGTAVGDRLVNFTVTRTNGLLADSFDWSVAGIQQSDLASGSLSGAVSFASGETSKVIQLRLKQDSTVEVNETLVLTLQNGNHATIVSAPTSVTLVNDDLATVSVAADVLQPVPEGDLADGGDYTNVSFTVTRTLPAGHAAGVPLLADRIDWSVATGGLGQITSADVHADDYAGTINFAEGEMTATVTLRVLRDTVEEGNKSIDLSISAANAVYSALGTSNASIMLADDDGKVTVTTDAASLSEGTAVGDRLVNFTVTRTNGLLADSFDWSVTGIQQSDLASGSLTGAVNFASGETSKIIQLHLKQDSTVEADETLVLTLQNGNHATIASAPTSVTLINDDLATVSVAADILQPVAEGDVADGGPYTNVSFTVTRTLPAGHVAGVPLLADRIDWAVATGGLGQITSADLHADDYSGTINFAEGQMVATVTLRVLRDTVEEGNKSIDLSISAANAVYSGLGTSIASIMLADDDAKVTVTTDAASVSEGTAAGDRLVSFTVTRTNGLLADSFDWDVAGIQQSDLASGSLTGTVNFNAGETSKIIQLHLKQDSTVEVNETLTLTLQNGNHATIVSAPTSVTLVNDDFASVSVAPNTLLPVAEGDVSDGGDYTNVSFTVTRTLPAGHAAGVPLLADRIDWSVATGGLGQITSTDLHADDYAGTINFAEGQLTATVTLRVLRDTVEEGNKSIDLSISAANAVYSALGTSNASIVLADDDAKVTVTTDTATVSEGTAAGDRLVNFTVTRTNGLLADSFDWSVAGIQQSDLASGSLTGAVSFASGETSKIIQLHLKQDSTVEADETLVLTLQNGNHATVASAPASVTIANDDYAVLKAGSDVAAILEGDPDDASGATQTMSFRITREAPQGQSGQLLADNLSWEIDFGVPGAVDASRLSVSKGTIAFAAGQTEAIVQIAVAKDAVRQGEQSVTLHVLDSQYGRADAVRGASRVNVIDDDPKITFATPSQSVVEGNAVSFTVERNAGLDIAMDVHWKVVQLSGSADALRAHFGGTLPSGTTTFAVGASQAAITLNSLHDGLAAADVPFVIVLESATGGAQIKTATALGTIVNKDAVFSVAALDASKFEGNDDGDATTPFVFRVTREMGQAFAHTLSYNLIGGGENSASIADDLILPADRSIHFAPGAEYVDVVVNVRADRLQEGNESFRFVLNAQGADNVLLAAASASANIIGDETALGVYAVAARGLEGTGAGTEGVQTFEIRLAQPTIADVVVKWNVRDFAHENASLNAATADFFGNAWPSGQVTITAGQTTAQVAIKLAADGAVEQAERYVIGIEVVSGPAAVTIPEAVGQIVNDDATLGFAAASFSANEGNPGADGVFLATVARNGFARTTVSAAWRLELIDGGANATDFVAGQDALGTNHGLPSGRIELQPGITTADIQVRLAGDLGIESAEKFRIVLEDPGFGTELAATMAEGSINNDDAILRMSEGTLLVEEGQIGQVRSIQVIVVRDGDTRGTDTVTWQALTQGADSASAADIGTSTATGNVLASGTVTFIDGASTAMISIPVVSDDTVEANENILIRLGTPSAGNTVDSAANETLVTIRNDDQLIGFAQSSASGTEDTLGATVTDGEIRYTLVRSGDLSKATSVDWSIDLTGKTASAEDFAALAGTATFAAGSSTVDVVVKVKNDIRWEADESFTVRLGSVPAGRGILFDRTSADGTIVNDDVKIVLQSVAQAQSEGDSGTVSQSYVLERIGDTSKVSEVNWSVSGAQVVVNGVLIADAVLPAELSGATSGTVRWEAGDTGTKTITIQTAGDIAAEGDEAFRLNLSSAQGDRSELLADGAYGLIKDDDATVGVTAGMPAIVEGKAGTIATVPFTVTRSGDSSGTLMVDWTATGASGIVNASGTVTFNPQSQTYTLSWNDGRPDQVIDVSGGSQSAVVNVQVQGDELLESGEALVFTLSNPRATPAAGHSHANAMLDASATSASVALTNDDDKLVTSAAQSSLLEGNDTDPVITYTITRTGDTSGETVVRWRIVGHGEVQVNAADFIAGQESNGVPNSGMPSGTVIFAAGQTSKTVTVRVASDVLVEGDEGLRLDLETDSGNTEIVDSAPVVLLADDGGVNVVARDSLVIEGSNPQDTGRMLTFDLVRVGQTNVVKTVNWSISGAAASDFQPGTPLSGTVSFGVGETGKAIQLPVLQDSVRETTSKSVTLTLTDPANGETRTASITLRDDDVSLAVSADVASVNEGTPASEGETATRNVSFTVTRQGDLNQATTVDWTIGGDVNAADFVGGVVPSGQVSFAANESIKTVTVAVKQDGVKENNEALTIQLANASRGASITGATATTTIVNDDALVEFDSNSLRVVKVEGDSGVTDYTFTLVRSGNLAQNSTVTWSLAGGGDNAYAAASRNDFASVINANGATVTSDALTGSVTFAANETSKTITVRVNADSGPAAVPTGYTGTTVGSLLEADEAFSLNLASTAPGTTVGGPAVGIIRNDDVRIQTTSLITDLREGTGTEAMTQSITLARQGDPSKAVSLYWYVGGEGFINGGQMSETDASFAGQMVAGTARSGIISWAAGDVSAKTISFTPKADDVTSGDYRFKLYVAPVPSATNATQYASRVTIDEIGVVPNGTTVSRYDFASTSGIELATFTVKRDESGIWVSNDVSTNYDSYSSRENGAQQQYNGYDYVTVNGANPWTGTRSPSDVYYNGSERPEGSYGTAKAGADYTDVSQTMNFTENNRVQQVTVAISNDAAFETPEALTLHLTGGAGITVEKDTALAVIRDDDNISSGKKLDVRGGTVIEGIDTHAVFKVTFGEALTEKTSVSLSLNPNRTDRASVALDLGYENGDPDAVSRMPGGMEYSTDGGATWQSPDVALSYTYSYYAEGAPQTDDQSTLVFDFSQSEGSYGFGEWLDFSDLAAGQSDLHVGGYADMNSLYSYYPTHYDMTSMTFDVWVAVDSAKVGDLSRLGISFVGSEGELTGAFAGVATLEDDSDPLNQEALMYFQNYVSGWGSEGSDVQGWFESEGANADVDFLKFTINWDYMTAMQAPQLLWRIDGLDASSVLAPQNNYAFENMRLLKDETIKAGTTGGEHTIALSSDASFGAGVGLSTQDVKATQGMLTSAVTGNTVANGIRELSITVTRTDTVKADEVPYYWWISGSLLEGSDSTYDYLRFDAGQASKTLTFRFNDGASYSSQLYLENQWNLINNYEATGMGGGAIELDAGTKELLVRYKLKDDKIDEAVEGISLNVSTDKDDFLVKSDTAKIDIVDNDAPVISVGSQSNVAFSGVNYLVKYIDVNNRNGETPNPYSLYSDAGSTQGFTVSMRVKGNWEISLLDKGSLDQGSVNGSVYTQHYGDLEWRSLPTAAPDADGYYTVSVKVPAGTDQIRVRTLDQTSGFSAQITQVDTVIVARDVEINEADGTATFEVVAVGGDLPQGGATARADTYDGAWVDRTFIFSREFAAVGEQRAKWVVEGLTPAQMPDGDNYQMYVRGYFGASSLGTVNSEDFVVLDGQSIDSITGLPSGIIVFADGQKEARLTLRVRADNVGEQTEEFRVRLVDAMDGAQELANPQGSATYGQRYENSGFGRTTNDDQMFTLTGKTLNEAVNQAGINATAPDGYTLHTFTITREGDSTAAASVDWRVVVSGGTVTGGIAAMVNDPANMLAGKADFASDGLYGFAWENVESNGQVRSVGKTVNFAAGESQKTVVFAVRNDALAESAELFRVVLDNPRALPGNDGTPGVSETRGFADFLVGDDDATKVKVAISSSMAPATDAATGLPMVEEGTGGTARIITLTFTRTGDLSEATQASYEMTGVAQGTNAITALDGATVTYNNSYWRGLVNFAANASTATVRFQIGNDNLVEADSRIKVTLYDLEHIPEALGGTTGWGGTSTGDRIGSSGTLPDWGKTIRDPNAYQAEYVIKNDDVRLWLNGFSDSRYQNPAANATPAATVANGGSAYEGSAASGNDLLLNFARAGRQDSDIRLNWSIVHGTTDNSDFVATSGTMTLKGTGSNTQANGYDTVQATLANFFAGDRNPEENESFQIVFTTTDSTNVKFTYDFINEASASWYWNNQWVNGPSRAGSNTMTVGVTVANDDVIYSIAGAGGQSTVKVTESNDGAYADFTFDVSRVLDGPDTNITGGYLGASSVKWRVVGTGNRPVDASDFVVLAGQSADTVTGLPGGVVSFAGHATAPEILKQIVLRVRGDSQVEYGESFRIELYDASFGHVSTTAGSANGVIVNDDNGILISDTVMREGDAPGTVSFTVTRVGDLSGTSTLDWSKIDVNTDEADFTGATAGSLSFAGTTAGMVDGYGEQTRTVTLNYNSDTQPEADQQFQVLLNNFGNVSQVFDRDAVATLSNDDASFSVAAAAADAGGHVEGDGKSYSFVITRSHDTVQNQTVSWAVVGAGGRNVADAADFGGTLPSGTVTFAPGELSKTITVAAPSGDDAPEADERFAVRLTLGAGAEGDTVAAQDAVGVIVNDDAGVYISDSQPTTQAEGTGNAARNYSFDVTRVGAQGTGKVDWQIVLDGTASADDFTGPLSGTLDFDGNGTKTVSVGLRPDSVQEGAESFHIVLSNASGMAIVPAAGNALGVIGDDDFSLTVANASVSEGDGSKNIAFTFTRVGATTLPAAVSWSVAAGTADANDFAGGILPSGSFTFPAGASSYVLLVPVKGDVALEANETFTLNVSYDVGNGSAVETTSATGTLVNDDEAFSIGAIATIAEGSAATPGRISFVINRDGISTGASSVKWTIAGSGEHAASADDFAALTGTVSFADGETSKTVTVNLVGDAVAEHDEGYTVTLSEASAASSIAAVNGARSGVIANDDLAFTLSAAQAAVDEGDAGVTELTWIIRRTGGSGTAESVAWTLALPGNDAAEAADFSGPQATAGTVQFAIGETEKTVTVRVNGDNLRETAAGGFTLSLGNPSRGAILGDSSATIVLQDDDDVISVIGESVDQNEGQGYPGGVYEFKVVRDGSLKGQSTVAWSIVGTGDHPASADDFAGQTSGLLSFADGESEKRIRVEVQGDMIGEFDENFVVMLSDPGAGTTVGAPAGYRIVNDDPVLKLVMNQQRVQEGDEGSDRPITFTITRSGDTSGEASVKWRIEVGSGPSGANADDFGGFLPSGTANFAAGQTEKTITVLTGGDGDKEGDEFFNIVLSDATGASIVTGRIDNATLVDDDNGLSISVAEAAMKESDNGQETAFRFHLAASGPAARVEVRWHVEAAGDHPVNGDDFVGTLFPSGVEMLTLNGGAAGTEVVVRVAGDNTVGPNESFRFVVDQVFAYDNNNQALGISVTGPSSIDGTILDDDSLIALNSRTETLSEGNSGTTTMRFEVSRSGSDLAMGEAATVHWEVRGGFGDAADAGDFVGNAMPSGSLTFAPNETRKMIEILVNGDVDVEATERFNLVLTGADDGAMVDASADTATGVITTEDIGLKIAAAAPVQAEDGARFVYDVLREGPADQALDVSYMLGVSRQAQEAGVGASADDFAGDVTGTIHFDAGQMVARFTLDTVRDAVGEADERFVFQVSAENAAPVWVENTIVNDDAVPPMPEPVPVSAMLPVVEDHHAQQV